MSLSAQTYRCAAASATAFWRSVATVVTSRSLGGASRSRAAPLGGRLACAAPEDDALEEAVPHHPVAPVGASRDLAARKEALDCRLCALVDRQAPVLVM